MTRRSAITRGVVCLLLGVLTTVAVAWGFALRGVPASAPQVPFSYGPVGGHEGRVLTWERRWFGGRARRAAGPEPVVAWTGLTAIRQNEVERPLRAFGQGWALEYEEYAERVEGLGPLITSEFVYGWPRPALWLISETLSFRNVRVDGIRLPVALSGPAGLDARSLPVRPMWGGLAANTAVFAAAWAAPVFGVPVLRARRRRRSGRCPACGYNLRGELAAGCPECGWGKE